ncbi:nitric oxide reductase activation protein NorD [Magnetospira sp. QH-2]|uniref:nitric oxide reductase activation protein NorD n=1 Tax=Magnetospira sp. (strain QH-2) TaxID=1288970 RepID=UPI0003E8107F|nr:nitric oxide reductase activation protein NorD [Magnetospira sp. QH-2]CCQ75099.1 Rubisco activation protein CbbO [Magnetospira sp. QH-2]
MSRVEFTEYLSCLPDDHPHLEALEATYHEAARIMSPQGLDHYLKGVEAMCSLGRGEDLLLSYIQEMPLVVKEVGEDIITDVIHSLMGLASHTSATVIVLMLQNLPLAAQRMGDAEVFRNYLKLIHQLAGKSPRGLRPMMENLDELLTKLTLGGLRRWAMWGAQAHQRDLDGQMAYFSLESESSKAVLQRERRGTLFVEHQRKLNFYLRALWGRAFFMKPTAGDYETRKGLQPYIENWFLHLPDAFDDYHGVRGIEIYRAAAAHCAAHLIYTTENLSAEQLTATHMKCIDLFEDARVEYLACQDFPGLQKLWLQFFRGERQEGEEEQKLHSAMDLMVRMARALMDDTYSDPIDEVNQQAAAFRTALAERAEDNQISWDAGMDFYHLMVRDGVPSVRAVSDFPIPYRDDNRYIWDFDEVLWQEQGVDYIPATQGQVRKQVNLMEFINEIDCETAGDDAQEIWVLGTELFPYEDAGEATVSWNDMEGKEPISEPFHYDEWDYHIQLHRPDWSTVIERRQGVGDPEVMDDILVKHRPIASQIRHLIDALQPQGVVRRRGYEEGEELDLNAAVRAMIDIRRGTMPDPRINIRITRHIRDLAVVLLLDLSESTNEAIDQDLPEPEEGQEDDRPTILSLTRESAGLLAWAIDSIGDPFAVHGFASDGRHDVQYYRFKDFDQPYDDESKSRLAGMKGGLSTRMGTALRHAGFHLTQQAAQKRLVLLVTDGEPADIDERDPQYLRHDAKKAVEDLAMQGIHTYCLTLDPQADQYVSRIFGENRYSIVDNVEKLPERLPAVFAALTG